MKKNILIYTLAIISAFALALPTLAVTTVSFSPANITNVVAGKNFSVVINVNPQGIANYVEKVELQYPSDLLEVRSFNFGSTWIALTQPSYDIVDNVNGILVKTAGYPRGISTPVTFGTVSFHAKKAGSGIIKLGNNSIAFEIQNQSALNGTPVLFTITAPTTGGTGTANQPSVIPEEAETGAITLAPETPGITGQTSLAAIIGAIVTLGTGKVWIGVLITIILLAVVTYAVYKLIQKRREKSEKI